MGEKKGVKVIKVLIELNAKIIDMYNELFDVKNDLAYLLDNECAKVKEVVGFTELNNIVMNINEAKIRLVNAIDGLNRLIGSYRVLDKVVEEPGKLKILEKGDGN